MYFSKVSVVSFGLLATSQLVAGHAAIIGATGDAGGAGSAIGGMFFRYSLSSSTSSSQ